MENNANEIMTVSDVADYLRIPVSSVYKLAQEGKIPGLKVGRHWRFHRGTLGKWIVSQTNDDEKNKYNG
jgi:excisionase family DNA binding protein